MSSIKFTHSDSGDIELHTTAVLNDLFILGAVSLTRKRTCPIPTRPRMFMQLMTKAWKLLLIVIITFSISYTLQFQH